MLQSKAAELRAEVERLKRRKAREERAKLRRRAKLVQLFVMVLFLCLSIPVIAEAAPVFAFLLGPSGLALFTGTTLTVVSSVLGAAASFGATYLLSSLFYEEPEGPQTGVRLDMASGATVPQSFIVGTYATAGSLAYTGSWGIAGKTPNAFLVQVIAVGDLPYSAINANNHFINGRKVSIDTGTTATVGGNNVGHPVTDYIVGGKTYMWIKFKDGTQTTQDPYLASVFNGIGTRPLDSNFIGRGRAYVIITSRYDPEVHDDLPSAVLSFDGIKTYDPRKDSTNGGSGSHRYGTYSTYEFTANLKAIHYYVKRGVYYGDNEEWMYGHQGLPAYLLDNASWFAAMNVCDEDVTLKAGGTEKRWRGGAEITCDSDYLDFSETLDRCVNGRTMESGGIFKTYCGAVGANVLTITDANVIATLDQNNKFIPANESMYNTIIGEYVSPDEGWQSKPTKAKVNSTYLAEDGGERLETSVSLPMLTKNSRAQRAINAMLNESRRNRSHVIALGPECFRLESLDCIGWTSDKFQYSTKKFIVGNVQRFHDQGYIVVSLREANPNDDAYNPATDEDDDEISVTTDLPPATQTPSVTVSAISIKNNAGVNKIPALKGTWTVDEDYADIKWVRYQVRLLDTLDTDVDEGQVRFDAGKVVVAKGIIKQEFYQIRFIFIPFDSGRPVAWSSWTTIQAPNTGDAGGVSDDPPSNLSSDPTIALVQRVYGDGKVQQFLQVSQDVTGRPATETYRVRVVDTTETPDRLKNYKTDEFPYEFEVQDGHTYTVRVVPVSRFGVAGTVTGVATGVTMPIPKKVPGSLTTLVPDVGSVTIDPGHKRNSLVWPEVDTSIFPDWSHTEIQRATNSGFSTGLRTYKRKTNSLVEDGIGNASQRWYRVRHVDTSGNQGNWSSSVNGTTARLVSDDYTSESVVTDTIKPYAVYSQTQAMVDFVKGPTTGGIGNFKKNNVFIEEGSGATDELRPLKVDNPLKIQILLSINLTTYLSVTGTTTNTSKPDGSVTVTIRQKGTKKQYVVGKITNFKKIGSTTDKEQKAISIPSKNATEEFLLEVKGNIRVPLSGGTLSGYIKVSGSVTAYVQKR